MNMTTHQVLLTSEALEHLQTLVRDDLIRAEKYPHDSNEAKWMFYINNLALCSLVSSEDVDT
jgi:Flp pilus assembly protein CpaB